MDYLLGAALGGLIAFFYSIPATILELARGERAKNISLVIEVKTIFGYRIQRREAFWVGLLLYMIVGMLFGSIYVFFVEHGWLFVTHRPYTFLSFLVFGFLSWLGMGLVVYPLLRMGFFGTKEGGIVWVETFVSHLLLAVTMAFLVHWYQPLYFFVAK